MKFFIKLNSLFTYLFPGQFMSRKWSILQGTSWNSFSALKKEFEDYIFPILVGTGPKKA